MRELQAREAPPEVVEAIAGHAPFLGVPRETDLARTLFAVDELSGFVLACAAVRPEGINGMTPKSVKKKLKMSAFAAAVSREDVRQGAEELGVDFDEHIATVIAALADRADELGLHGTQGAPEPA
jgi:predicted hydrolase (HD superfamily)